MGEKVLVIGSGGREHTLAWKLKQSKEVDKVYVAPGNGGTAQIAENVPINVTKGENYKQLADFVVQNQIDLTVVGPEEPLVKGIVDYWENNKLVLEGNLIFGPSQQAASLEGSKAFAKNFMKRHNIPTADFETFLEPEKALDYVKSEGAPIVVKASGLAAGKGALVCQTLEQAVNAVERILVDKEFGDEGKMIVVEKFMQGEEASILALTDGKTIRTLVSSQDHKPVYDGDKGPNTGGMGAYAPAPIVTDDVMQQVYDKILIPTIKGMEAEGNPFQGCLYAGLMIKDGKPKVVEFNVRMGDPETQPVLSLLESDLYVLLRACAEGNLDKYDIKNKQGASCCVVMASGGYPESGYKKGKEISGLEAIDNMQNVDVFHAGTKKTDDGKIITSGGRVLGVTGTASDIKTAIDSAYLGVKSIKWDNEYHRTDIGAKALGR
jgi:phosphoribosylamine--glycine ligase